MRRLAASLATAALFAPAALALPSAMHPELGAKLLGKNEVPQGITDRPRHRQPEPQSGRRTGLLDLPAGRSGNAARRPHPQGWRRRKRTRLHPARLEIQGQGLHLSAKEDDRRRRDKPQRLLRQRAQRQIPKRHRTRPTRRRHGAHVTEAFRPEKRTSPGCACRPAEFAKTGQARIQTEISASLPPMRCWRRLRWYAETERMVRKGRCQIARPGYLLGLARGRHCMRLHRLLYLSAHPLELEG